MSKSKKDYEGIYVIGRTPPRLADHNRESWDKIEELSANSVDGSMDFNVLSDTVIGHKHGTENKSHAYQFITYCIRCGYLKEKDMNEQADLTSDTMLELLYSLRDMQPAYSQNWHTFESLVIVFSSSLAHIREKEE